MIIINPVSMDDITIESSNLIREDLPEWSSGGPAFIEPWRSSDSEPYERSVKAVFSPDGSRIAIIGNHFPYIRILDGNDYFEIDGPELIQVTAQVTDVAFSQDGSLLALTCYGSESLNRRAVYVWNTTDWTLEHSIVDDLYTSVDFGGSLLFLKRTDFVDVLSTVDFSTVQTLAADGYSFSGRDGVSSAPNGNYFAVIKPGDNETLQIYQTSDYALVRERPLPSLITAFTLTNAHAYIARERLLIKEDLISGVSDSTVDPNPLRISHIAVSSTGLITASGRNFTSGSMNHYSDSLVLSSSTATAGVNSSYNGDSTVLVSVPRVTVQQNNGAYRLYDVTDSYSLISGTPNEYLVGDQVIRFDRIYESLSDGNTTAPEIGVNLETPNWLDLGYTNDLRFIDGNSSPPSTAVNEIDVTISADGVNSGIVFFNVDADSIQVIVTDPEEGVVYENTLPMISQAEINNWWDYFFLPYTLKSDSALIDLPTYPNASIRIIVKKEGGIAKLGNLALGKIQFIGNTLYGTSVGIIDYSKKETDDFGNFSILERNFSKRVDFDGVLPTNQIAGVQQILASIRATPVVWIGDEDKEETIVFGYFRDFDITIEGPCDSDITISVEGL